MTKWPSTLLEFLLCVIEVILEIFTLLKEIAFYSLWISLKIENTHYRNIGLEKVQSSRSKQQASQKG